MFKYLFKKNIKKDSDYKKYHLIWFPLTVIFLFLFLSVMYRQIKDIKIFYSSAIGGIFPILGYGIWLVWLLHNPKRLRAARLKITDERRKLLEQEAWAHIGQFLLGVATVVMFLSIEKEEITVSLMPLVLLVYLSIDYYFYRLRK